jgi:hypothetical protein
MSYFNKDLFLARFVYLLSSKNIENDKGIFFYFAQQPPSGPSHSRCFYITLNDAPQTTVGRSPLDE